MAKPRLLNGGGQWAGAGTCGKTRSTRDTSRGTGELILQALESGATNILSALAVALQMMAAQAWYRRGGEIMRRQRQ